MHCTGTLRVHGRGVDQEHPGKEQQNGNCGRLEGGKRTSLRSKWKSFMKALCST